MAVIAVDGAVVATVGAVRAIVIARLVDRLRADADRGAAWTRYADRLLAEDTGLSVDEVKRARRWWQDIGVLVCVLSGMPRAVEYSVRECLERWDAWCAANGLQSGASAQQAGRWRTASGALAHGKRGASARTDQRDQDDQEREIMQLALKQGWSEEDWRREAAAIRARCAVRGGVRDLEAYTYASLITAAQAGPRARVQPQQENTPRRRVWRRPVVTYTEAEREAARERARQRLLAIQSGADAPGE